MASRPRALAEGKRRVGAGGSEGPTARRRLLLTPGTRSLPPSNVPLGR